MLIFPSQLYPKFSASTDKKGKIMKEYTHKNCPYRKLKEMSLKKKKAKNLSGNPTLLIQFLRKD